MFYEAQVVYQILESHYVHEGMEHCVINPTMEFGKKCSIKADTIDDAVKQALAIRKKNWRPDETWVRLRDQEGQEVATVYSEDVIKFIEDRPTSVSGIAQDRWDLI